MGFTSFDDLITQITVNGKTDTVLYQKTTGVANILGSWYYLGVANGMPSALALTTGTNLTYYPTDDTATGATYHGGNVSTATKHFLHAGASVYAAAGAPFVLMCIDQVGYVPVTSVASAARTVTMTALGAGDRYPNGEGLRAFFVTTATLTGGGPNITVFQYTNSAGTTGRTCPVTVSTAATASAPLGTIIHSGAAASRHAPFIPLASGDTGIKDIEGFTLSGGTAYSAGSFAIVLCKPLWVLPIPASGVHTVLDFVNACPSMRRIKDGANLQFLLFQTGATSANSPVLINFDYAYGG